MKSRNLSHILKSEDSAVQKTKPQNIQILIILTVYFPFLKLQQKLNCLFGNTVNTLYSEVLNLHYMVNLDEKWSKIFAIW